MLNLDRKIGEQIVITTPQGQVTIRVEGTRWRDGQREVVLGIQAPRDMPVDREEIRRRKLLEGAGS